METRKTFIIIARHFEINLKNMVTRWIREYKDGKYGDIDITT
jgi:transposase